MKAVLMVIGKTDEGFVQQEIDKYKKRVGRYMPFDLLVIPDIKKAKHLSEEEQKKREGEEILKRMQNGDYMVLLDENGKNYTSVAFAKWLNTIFVSGNKRLVFVIGGPYGFSEEVYKKAQSKISLSKMTFSHQIIRVIFMEQFYRAHTILKGEPYHHQ